MQENFERRIRENVSVLVDLTWNPDDVITTLREKEVLTESEKDEILGAETPFDKKSKLYWFIRQKDDAGFEALVEALKATGNESAAEKLSVDVPERSESAEEEQEQQVIEEPSSFMEVKVSVEHREDHEGIALADEIEKELDRIQSEDELADNSANVVETHDKLDNQEEEMESEVKVEITPAESVEADLEQEVQIEEPAPMEEEIAPVKENGFGGHHEVEEQDEEVSTKSAKQVSFGGVAEDSKEFVIQKEEENMREDLGEMTPKSIVAMNRQKFEKSKPGGGSPIKYSFNKESSTSPVPVADEPKESTVKNLRNFFQKLGTSTENEDVLKRQGSKTGGVNPNRRTMAL